MLKHVSFYLFKLTVYLGKRDFVDHVDIVEPVGMPFLSVFNQCYACYGKY